MGSVIPLKKSANSAYLELKNMLGVKLQKVESLIEHPAIMTHASIDPSIREKLGISDTLLRISVGIEDVDDLIADLDQALSKI